MDSTTTAFWGNSRANTNQAVYVKNKRGWVMIHGLLSEWEFQEMYGLGNGVKRCHGSSRSGSWWSWCFGGGFGRLWTQSCVCWGHIHSVSKGDGNKKAKSKVWAFLHTCWMKMQNQSPLHNYHLNLLGPKLIFLGMIIYIAWSESCVPNRLFKFL